MSWIESVGDAREVGSSGERMNGGEKSRQDERNDLHFVKSGPPLCLPIRRDVAVVAVGDHHRDSTGILVAAEGHIGLLDRLGRFSRCRSTAARSLPSYLGQRRTPANAQVRQADWF